MADWKSYSPRETRERRDDVVLARAPRRSLARFLEGFFGGWGALRSASWRDDGEPLEEAAGVVRLQAIGERAERLVREARALLPTSSPEPAGAALAEAQAAIRELTALAVEVAERALADAGTGTSIRSAPPGAEAVDRLKRLSAQERELVAAALLHREQLRAAGGERRTLRVVPLDDQVVVQARPPDDRRRGLDTYVLDQEELLGLLPPEEAQAVH